jgi:hypothetical protein
MRASFVHGSEQAWEVDLKIAAVRGAGLRFEIDPDSILPTLIRIDPTKLFSTARPRRALLPAPASRAMKSSGAKMTGD